jgi:ComEC/Rec2-related protein
VPRIVTALVGVVLGILGHDLISGAALMALMGPAAFVLTMRRKPVLGSVVLLLFALCAGWVSWHLHESDGARVRGEAVDFPRCSIEGSVLEHSALGTFSAVERTDCSGAQDGVVVTGALSMPPGARFMARGWLAPLDPDGFGAARSRHGADAEFLPTSVIPSAPPAGAHAAAERFRRSLNDAAERLPPERKGLILGMTIGDTSAIPGTLLGELRRAGLTHLLAVSGSNVAIVLGTVALALRRLPLRTRIAGAAVALAFFVLVVGPEPSVLRAAMMGGIGLVALLTGHPTRSLHLLALGLLVLLLIRPALVYAPGLHLSAAATLGIVLWANTLAARFTRVPKPVALAAGATLAAQFAVAPVLVATFGEFSLVAPVANVLAFPPVAPITILGSLAGAVGLLWPTGGSVLMATIAPLAGWVATVGERFGGLDWASVGVSRAFAVPLGGVVLLAATLSLRLPKVDVVAPREDGPVTTWLWRLHDPEGKDMRETDGFDSKEAAEAWMGAEWQSLLDEGAESVSLVEDDVTIYVMGLKEA